MNCYIATCDKTSYILQAFCYLADKYIPSLPVTILGYSQFPALPIRFNLVRLANSQNSPDEWCANLFNYFSQLQDEYLIFGLDDFLPTCALDEAMVTEVLKLKPARYELGNSHCWHKSKELIADTVYQYAQDALYRISTQFSVWRRDYLLRALKAGASPWTFEVNGSKEACNDGELVVATTGKTAWGWVEAGAISSRHPGKVNVAGLSDGDIEELIELGYLDPDTLQLGMKVGENAKYTRVL